MNMDVEFFFLSPMRKRTNEKTSKVKWAKRPRANKQQNLKFNGIEQ